MRGARYDIPDALSALTLPAKLLTERLSVTVAIRRPAHGGVASAGRDSTFPKPVGAAAEVIPRSPSGVTIVCARRGETSGDAEKKSRLYTARREKMTKAIYRSKAENHYYADVFVDPIKLLKISGGGETDGVNDMDSAKECLPDDMGPAPGQVAHVGEVRRGLRDRRDGPRQNNTRRPV